MQNVAHWLQNSTLGSDVFQSQSFQQALSKRQRLAADPDWTFQGGRHLSTDARARGAPLWGVRFRNRLLITEHHLRFEMQFCDIAEKAAT